MDGSAHPIPGTPSYYILSSHSPRSTATSAGKTLKLSRTLKAHPLSVPSIPGRMTSGPSSREAFEHTKGPSSMPCTTRSLSPPTRQQGMTGLPDAPHEPPPSKPNSVSRSKDTKEPGSPQIRSICRSSIVGATREWRVDFQQEGAEKRYRVFPTSIPGPNVGRELSRERAPLVTDFGDPLSC